MENKNTIIALVLMGVVWMGFSLLFPSKPSPTTATSEVAQTAETPSPVATPTTQQDVPEQTITAEDQAAAKDIVVDTEYFRAVLTSSGARIKSLALKKYRVSADPESAPVTLIDVPRNNQASLATSGSDGWAIPSDAIYHASADDLQVHGDDSAKLVFSWTSDSGLEVEKSYTFGARRYDYDLVVRIKNQSETVRSGNLSLSLLQSWDDGEKISSFDFIGPMTLVGDKLHTDAIKDVAKESKTYQAPVWSGFETKYFMTALIPGAQTADKVMVMKLPGAIENRFESPTMSVAAGEAVEFTYVGFFGPRDLDIVKQVNHRLDEAIDFGYFSPLALPLRLVLNFFYGFVGNYGVAIILLTVIIKLLFWPLTQKSYSSMKEMQKLQPEMQRIREKFKKDKERLNQEIMQLYKTKRVNPLGGCLPMLVQIPVFFALYKVLMVDIGLRHAPFFLWLTDLSVKDPYYITPVIMGVTMFVQQKMTPSSMDPTQAKVFMLMPVIFTFMFLNFPSGLVIYWLVNNLLTILQQYLIRREKTA